MANGAETYTYQGGEKIALAKHPDQFVVRATPEELVELGVAPEAIEEVSPGSSRVTVDEDALEGAMDEARDLAPTHHAYYESETGAEFLITDRIFVTFHNAMATAELDTFAARYGLILLEAYSERDYLFRLTDDTGMNPVKLVVILNESDPQVESADHDLNHLVTTYALALPTDPFYPQQWHLHTRLNHAAFDSRASTRCEAAWQLLDGFGSADVVVGVTDDGCKLDHTDFDEATKFAGWGYFAGIGSLQLVTRGDVGADPAQLYQAGADHGTACAGVIAGEVDALRIVGAAPGCRLLPIRWPSSGPFLSIGESRLLAALKYMADKVDVISNSWGSTPSSTWSTTVKNRIAALAQTGGRRGRGIVFLWAAGNENCPIEHTTIQDVPFDDGWNDSVTAWVGVSTSKVFHNTLVGIPGVMHVAALASNAQRSHYSNYGTGIGICAPTSNRHEYRRLTVTGLRITTASGDMGLATPGVTPSFGGTSSATPLVAGIAALVIGANPALSAFDVISILKQTASKDLRFDAYPRTPPSAADPDPSWDISPIVPFDQPGFTNIGDPDGTWSPWFGHGRVDALAAVTEALRRRGAGPAQRTVRESSAPAAAIPDATTGGPGAGVSDTIHIADDITIGTVKVTVDIDHTFIGDLRVTLAPPVGSAAVLHNRSGHGADNLKRSYDAASVPRLGLLTGQSARGDWTLTVQDFARQDTGRLNRWELEIGGQDSTTILLEEAPGVPIPDDNTDGIERSLASAAAGTLRAIEATVDITHPFIADLVVTLVSPAGTQVVLHERSGGAADNILQTYTAATTAGLGALGGEAIQGTWRLRVADLAGKDVGKLNRWALKLSPEA